MLCKQSVLELLHWELEGIKKNPEGSELLKKYVDTRVNALMEVLDPEFCFFTLVGKPYSDQIKMVVAHIIEEDAEKAELCVAVDLYDQHFNVWNTTDGWLVSEIDEDARWRPKVKARKLFIPHPDLSYEWETYGDAFFDSDGKPVVTYLDDCDPDKHEVHQVRWMNIQTGERLHPDSVHKHLEATKQ